MSGTDPKYTLKELIKNNINHSALQKDNGDAAKFHVMYAVTPEVLVKDFFIKNGYDVIAALGRAEASGYRHIQNVPILYKGDFPVTVYVIDKSGITAHLLRWQVYTEIRNILRVFSTYQHIGMETDDDRIVAGKMLYSSTFTIRHDDFV